jgi:hypothetical protein
MAKSKGAKKALDSYTVKGTHKVVKGEKESSFGIFLTPFFGLQAGAINSLAM